LRVLDADGREGLLARVGPYAALPDVLMALALLREPRELLSAMRREVHGFGRFDAVDAGLAEEANLAKLSDALRTLVACHKAH
jgi:hypothetical protein